MLAVLCGEKDGIRDVSLPQHWMRDFFLAHLCLEMQHNAEGLSRLQACACRVSLGLPSSGAYRAGFAQDIFRTSCAVLAQALSEQFPSSEWIVCQAAIAHYNLRNFDEAEDLFQDLLERDPHRIEVLACCAAALLLSTVAPGDTIDSCMCGRAWTSTATFCT